MKLRVLVLMAVTVLGGSVSHAADAPKSTMGSDKSYNITMAPLGLAFGSFNAGFGFKVGDSSVLSPKISYSSYSSTVGTVESKATSFGFGLDYTIFLGGPAFESGWTLTPSVEYAIASNSGLSASGIGLGADIGYWWFWDGGFNLGLGAGIQYVGVDFTKVGLTSISAVLPSFLLRIGYAF